MTPHVVKPRTQPGRFAGLCPSASRCFIERCGDFNVLQERWFSTLVADAVEALMTNFLTWQKITSAEEQEERQEHRRIEGASTETASKHRGSQLFRGASGVIIRGPVVVEMVAQVVQQLLNSGLPAYFQYGLPAPDGRIVGRQRRRRAIEIERDHDRRQIRLIIQCGPEDANVPGPAVGQRGHERSAMA